MTMAMGSMSDMPATMTMADMPATMTMTAPMASGTDMSGMDAMDMMGGCKINMLWNWYTIDACFISSSWRITSNAMFAGSCIGIVLLVIILEFLRRAGKEYDRYIVAQHNRSRAAVAATNSSSSSDNGAGKNAGVTSSAACAPGATQFRPSFVQQAVRALLHMLQFAIAYFVMLLAMYYNGYFIICIFIGAYLGYFIFGWESFNVGSGGSDRMQEEATVCCG